MTDDDRYEAMAKVAGLQALKITEQGRRLLDAEAKIAALGAWVEYLKPQNTQLSAQLAEAKTEVEVLRHCNAWQARELNQLRPAPEAKDLEPAPPALSVNEWVAQHADRHAVLLFPRLDPDAPPEPQPLWAGVDFSDFQPDCPWPKVWPNFSGVVFDGSDRSATLFKGSPMEGRIPAPETVEQWAARHIRHRALREIDQRVEDWHEGRAGTDQTLHEFLGMSWAEYSLWVTQPSALTEKQIRHHLLGALRLPPEPEE